MHSEIVRRQGRLWTPFLTVSAFVLAVQSRAADEVQRPVNERFVAADTQEIPSFQRHVVNLFGRLGCNGRSCHGSFQGRGGFQLSLFGYDFKADHAALLAKDSPRIDVAHPEQSLILVKATQPDGDGFSPDDVAATFYHSLGIDHTKEYHTSTGRPITIVRGGQIIRELCS